MPIHHPYHTEVRNATEPAAFMRETARAFLASLDSGQRNRAVFAVGDSERYNWDYRPAPRAGLPFTEMDAGQQRRALALLASGLSRRGTVTALDIMSLETVLAGLEGSAGSIRRDPELYYVTIFGEPEASGPWGWRLEGHHLSVNFLIATNGRIACTPNFFGANPAVVPAGPLQGFRTLPQEEAVARELLAALDKRQAARAIVDRKAPPDIITRWAAHIRLDEPVGLACADLAEEQRHVVSKLLRVYLGRMAPRLADWRMNDLAREGLGAISFSWAGSQAPGEPHYYRLHGPGLLVEYDNTQNNANHIHSVWRDLKQDWGDDALQQHYADSH